MHNSVVLFGPKFEQVIGFLMVTITCQYVLAGNSDLPSHSGYSSASVKEHVVELASDKFEGRGAGYHGEALAAEYIAKQFEAFGLKPVNTDEQGWKGYIQSFQMHALDSTQPWQILTSQNVVGVLPGSQLDDGYIVIGGHYDGQGKQGQAALGRNFTEGDTDYIVADGDVIWNSAVDNAVSIAAILEIAKKFSQSSKLLRRSIVFVAFGAEESALDGSTFYANNPVGGRNATKAMINLEKIIGDADAEFLYVSYGTSKVFPGITKSIVEQTKIDLTPFYPGVIANTDHYAFILSGIPAITIGTGSIQNVHTPSDHADGLDYELLARRTSFIAQYLSMLANIDDTFAFSGDITGRFGASGGPATNAERDERGFKSQTAFKIATVVDGSPASVAGLRPGDLIIAVNNVDVPKQDFYQGLEDLLPEDERCNKAKFAVRRTTGDVTITVSSVCEQ